MALNYTTYVSQLANLLVVPSSDTNFTTFLPGCIDYAEQRIYREGDFLATRVADTSATFSSATRTFTLPTTGGTFLVVEGLYALSPAGALSSGTLNPLVPVSLDWLEAAFPSNVVSNGVPAYWARFSAATILVAPCADAPYIAQVLGTIRPTPLSSGNSSTYLTQSLPDLFMAASMVFATGFQRDFGAQSDNPQASQSWEQQYQHLFQSAQVEELRKKYQSQGWSNAQPSPLATARSG